MDLKIQEDIQFEALSVYSTNLVKARSNLQYIRNKIDNPNTDTNDVAKFKSSLQNVMGQYNAARMQQATIKQATLSSLYNKYPISPNEIRQTLEDAVTEYENVSKGYMEFDNELKGQSLSITIPLYSNPNNYDLAVLTHVRNKLNNPSISMNETHILHKDLESAIKQYSELRNKQIIDRNNELRAIYKKYPVMNTYGLRPALDAVINKYDNLNIGEEDSNESVSISIPVYAKPTRLDMAVILVYFNACEYKKLAQNLLLTYQTLVRADIPVFLVEHCFKDQVPLFKENGTTIFNTKSDSYMFYKENLINWLFKRIPEQYTKFYMMDCDLLFEKDTWYDDVSALLDTHEMVQPFQEAVWLDYDFKSVNKKYHSFMYNYTLNKHGHPGFAWAARRDFIQPKGLFDLCIIGSGDTFLASSLKGDNGFNKTCSEAMPWIIPAYNVYYKQFINTRFTHYPQSVYHLWHGSEENRDYYNRYTKIHDILANIQNKDELLELNSYGIYEYTIKYRDNLNKIILNYFKSRNEDGLTTLNTLKPIQAPIYIPINEQIHIIMCCYRRHHHLQDIIKAIDNQTVASHIIFHIINTNPEKWTDTIEIKNNTPVKNITIHLCNTGDNLYGYARFLYTKYLLRTETIPYVIFFDDDQLLPSDWIEKIYLTRRPSIYACQYGVIFKRHETVSDYSYWERTFTNSFGNNNSILPEKVDYGATCGCIVDTQIFVNDMFFRCPRPYRDVEDLWLSYFVNTILKWDMQIFHISLNKSQFNDTEETALWHTIKDKKTNFLKILIKTGFLTDNVCIDELNKILEPDDSNELISKFIFI